MRRTGSRRSLVCVESHRLSTSRGPAAAQDQWRSCGIPVPRAWDYREGPRQRRIPGLLLPPRGSSANPRLRTEQSAWPLLESSQWPVPCEGFHGLAGVPRQPKPRQRSTWQETYSPFRHFASALGAFHCHVDAMWSRVRILAAVSESCGVRHPLLEVLRSARLLHWAIAPIW